ncbi:FecR family protein [Chitinophaga solisilvae]|uniref:DUF4974 domain-containing protein n=1 Tax=Chitinophaga solisilvae TaxID=1233460 RepID=A0A433W9V9_9BACT|nr:FecR domain-containing protein [Chitinophaga solisilvae]NSL87111.1 DUF4974 domain-containing protein [Chitinophaga solisilvae]
MNKDLIAKYFAGRCTADESRKVQQWLDEQGPEWVDQYMAAHWDADAITSTAEERSRLAAGIISMAPVRKGRTRWLRIAVAAACITAIAATCWILLPGRTQALAWTEISNNSDSIRTIQLPDASVVTLNKTASLRYSSAYNRKNRMVVLEGEAFFEVRPDANRPFLVQAGTATARVYGTAFNVNALPGASELRVALQSGKIGVTCDSNSAEKIMTPGQLLVFNKQSHEITMLQSPAENADSWRKGELHFVNAPFRDVLLQLENTYGLHVVYHGQPQQQTVTASFPAGNLPKVLQHLSFIWELDFRQRGDSVFIK